MSIGTVHRSTPQVAEANAAVRLRLPFADTKDFDDARRGRIGSLSDPVIRATDGRVVWDAGAYGFLDADCPETVNPSLWRQGQLVSMHGLFEVTEGIYQVRGLDLSNMTIVEGDAGVLVIDPLISVETAAAALALYRKHRGDRPVTGVRYTHSHVDHFGGVRGVVDAADVASGRIPVLAPEGFLEHAVSEKGFLEHAVSENVYAGGAMTRRATYMYGALLPKGPGGQVGAGLGQTTSLGTVTLIAPTVDIAHTGQEEIVDGIRMVFQVTPDTEAPAEMNFLFPDRRAVCTAETRPTTCTTSSRCGAPWCATRTAGRATSSAEIAEQFELPPSLGREWHCRGHLPPGRFHRQPLRRAAVRRHRGPDRRPARGRP